VTQRRRLTVELLALALIVSALVVLLTRLLHVATFFDEGVYLVSLDDLRHGAALGRDVFVSQGPGFYVLLQAVGAVFGVTVTGVRLGFVAIAALGAIPAYLLGRTLAGPVAGLLAAGLITVAPLLPQYGGLIFADAPAMTLAVASLWLAAARRPAAAGAAFAGAVLVKFSAFTALPSILALLVYQRSVRRALAAWLAGLLGLIAVFAIAYARDLGALWSDAVSYHVDARAIGGLPNSQTYLDYFVHGSTTPFIWLVGLGAVASLLEWRKLWPLWLWPACATIFMLEQRPLRPNHVLVMPYAFAVPTAVALGLALRRLPPRTVPVAVATLGILLAVGWAQQLRRTAIGRASQDPGLIAAAGQLERVTRPGDLVISDQPIVAFLAHRRVPGNLVDTASLRFTIGSLSVDGLLGEIDHDPRITAVVVGRAFAREAGLVPAIHRRFARVLRTPAATIFYARRG
jgi:hypothetical protein